MTDRQVRIIPRWLSRHLLEQGLCFYCGLEPVSEIDHVIPVSSGATSVASNLVGACYECNREKGARSVSEWFTDYGIALEKSLLARAEPKPPGKSPKYTTPSVQQLFAVFTDRDACWTWEKWPNSGMARDECTNERVLVHRWAYIHFRGLPDGYVVPMQCSRVIDPAFCQCHKNHQCVNPWHREAHPKLGWKRSR